MRALAVLEHELRLFFVALQFLTRVPVPAWTGHEPEWMNRSVRQFPLVGALVGVAGAAVACLAVQLWPPAVAATLAVATTVWLCAAFHEDGLADTFDALLGAASRERAMAIMKDSRIGTYGTAALVLSLLLRVLLLAVLLAYEPVAAALALVAAHAAGRAASVALMPRLPYGGDEAHAKAKPLARAVSKTDAMVAVAVGSAFLMVGASGTPQPLVVFAAGWAALGALVLVMRAWLARRLGGYTGDTLGATEQLGEILVLMTLSASVSP